MGGSGKYPYPTPEGISLRTPPPPPPPPWIFHQSKTKRPPPAPREKFIFMKKYYQRKERFPSGISWASDLPNPSKFPIPSMVGVRIFSGTTQYILKIREHRTVYTVGQV